MVFFMVEFAYNNTKNANISHILFEFNYGYYSYIFYNEILIYAQN